MVRRGADNSKKAYAFHLLPSGLLEPSSINLIGGGCVINVREFFDELEVLEKAGVDTKGRVFVSDRAHVVFDLHQRVDNVSENELGASQIGTTKKGIGPCYSTKAARSGVRVGEIADEKLMNTKLRALASSWQKRYGDLLQYDVEEEIKRFDQYRTRLAPFIVNQVPLVKKEEDRGGRILVEGANALLLDLDYGERERHLCGNNKLMLSCSKTGAYPIVTSSNTGIGGVFTGLAISPFKIKEIIGVVKVYMTRIGRGPFPTELRGEMGDRLQKLGGEFGVTTGRKRTCGWLDLVILRYSCTINHYTALNLTKLDILDDYDEIQVGVGYTLDGAVLEDFPADMATLDRVGVTYKTFPGWKQKTASLTDFDRLPQAARDYVKFIEDFVGVKIKWIGTGPERESMIFR